MILQSLSFLPSLLDGAFGKSHNLSNTESGVRTMADEQDQMNGATSKKTPKQVALVNIDLAKAANIKSWANFKKKSEALAKALKESKEAKARVRQEILDTLLTKDGGYSVKVGDKKVRLTEDSDIDFSIQDDGKDEAGKEIGKVAVVLVLEKSDKRGKAEDASDLF